MEDIAQLCGKWQVVEIPDLVDDYLDLGPDPHISLAREGPKEIGGTYLFGAQSGDLDGRVERTSDNRILLTFTFEGKDDMDSVHGFGTALLVEKDTLKGEMRYHRADIHRFTWRRIG